MNPYQEFWEYHESNYFPKGLTNEARANMHHVTMQKVIGRVWKIQRFTDPLFNEVKVNDWVVSKITELGGLHIAGRYFWWWNVGPQQQFIAL